MAVQVGTWLGDSSRRGGDQYVGVGRSTRRLLHSSTNACWRLRCSTSRSRRWIDGSASAKLTACRRGRKPGGCRRERFRLLRRDPDVFHTTVVAAAVTSSVLRVSARRVAGVSPALRQRRVVQLLVGEAGAGALNLRRHLVSLTFSRAPAHPDGATRARSGLARLVVSFAISSLLGVQCAALDQPAYDFPDHRVADRRGVDARCDGFVRSDGC